MDWAELFPAKDFEFVLRLRREEPAAYFRPRDSGGSVLTERRHWLDTASGHHLVATDAVAPVVREFLRRLADWQLLEPAELDPSAPAPAAALLDGLGRRLEPDLIFLQRDAGAWRLAGGCVCFPSSWSLAEKRGLAVDQIHSIVPGLNPAVGRSIDQFLGRMAPGIAWCRANWGLSRWGDRNQDPWRGLPRLASGLDPASLWVRVEHQALLALPETNGILFAIRVESEPMGSVAQHPPARRGLLRALSTMPEEMAAYKGLQPVRAQLCAWLDQG